MDEKTLESRVEELEKTVAVIQKQLIALGAVEPPTEENS